jgi:hypothetical protein
LERAVVSDVLAVLACVVILAVIGLGFYGLKSRTGWLRIQAGVWRLVTFSIEIGQPGVPDKPREELRELEADGGRGGSESSDTADQDNAAA